MKHVYAVKLTGSEVTLFVGETVEEVLVKCRKLWPDRAKVYPLEIKWLGEVREPTNEEGPKVDPS